MKHQLRSRWRKSLSPIDLGEFMLVENCQKLNVTELTKCTKGQLLETLLNSRISATGQALRLTTTDCHFGGKRYWLICPNCNKRVGTLYQKPTKDDLFCRQCHKLTYLKTRYHKMF